MKAWPHQIDGAAFVLKWKKAALVHDTGTGKTKTGIDIADQIGAMFILVLCPVIAVEHWKDQFIKHGRLLRSSTIVRHHDAPFHSCNVLIVPFSLISKYPNLAHRLRQYLFDLILIDEAHALKGMDANRTRLIYGIGEKFEGLQERAPYVVLLSATLMPNHPGELYPHLKALRPGLLERAQNYEAFVNRYCEIRIAWRNGVAVESITGAKKLTAPELKTKLGSFIHRAKKRDVQKDLPPFVIDTWPVNVADLGVPRDIREAWEKADAQLAREIGPVGAEEALAIARASKSGPTERRLTGLIKLPAMVEALTQDLESNRKVIAFSYHHEVIDKIARWFAKVGVVTLDGRTTALNRIAAVKAFREDPKVRLFNGQINAAGEVIDLTPCSSLWILENDWTPKTLIQAIGRANRPGQVEPLTVRVLTLAGSIDDALARTLIRKTGDIEMLLEQ